MTIESIDTAEVDQAINRVLEAERESRAAVARCADQAAAMLATARSQAERITRRMESRSQRLSEIADRQVARAQQEHDAKPVEGSSSEGLVVDDGLQQVIESLVDEIVGARE